MNENEENDQLIARIIVSLVLIYIVITLLYLIYCTITPYCFKLYKCLLYKKATIVPIQLAIITEEPTCNIATLVHTEPVIVISK